MKRFILCLIPILLLASCAEKQQSPVSPNVPPLGILAFATRTSNTPPTWELTATPYGGLPPYTVWWSHPIEEADSTGDTLIFIPEWAGDFPFIAQVRDAAGQIASDPVVVYNDSVPVQMCWEDSVRLSVSSANRYKETNLENPSGLYYVILRITYTYDPRTGFDVIGSDGIHTVFEIIDPNPNRTGTETLDLLLPVQFWFAENQRIAFTFQDGASNTYAKLVQVRGCTEYPHPTDDIPLVTVTINQKQNHQ